MARCGRDIKYDGIIWDFDGNATTEPDMIPEKIYKRRDNGDGTWGVQIQEEPTDQLPQNVTYYKIAFDGLYGVTVFAPMGYAQVNDSETGITALIAFGSIANGFCFRCSTCCDSW